MDGDLLPLPLFMIERRAAEGEAFAQSPDGVRHAALNKSMAQLDAMRRYVQDRWMYRRGNAEGGGCEWIGCCGKERFGSAVEGGGRSNAGWPVLSSLLGAAASEGSANQHSSQGCGNKDLGGSATDGVQGDFSLTRGRSRRLQDSPIWLSYRLKIE